MRRTLCLCLFLSVFLAACVSSPADLQRQGLIPTSIPGLADTQIPPSLTPQKAPATAASAGLPSPLPSKTLASAASATQAGLTTATPTLTPTSTMLPDPTAFTPLAQAPALATAAPVVSGFIGGVSACPQGCLEMLPGCEIKGNINNKGVKIYHVPGSTWYTRTKISPEKGERWFCTTQEAEANGWRAPYN